MSKKTPRPFIPIEHNLAPDKKMELLNLELKRLIDHFKKKATRSKGHYKLYKYSSILLASATTIISYLMVHYEIPQWILPITSAAATVAVAFLGASGAQKIWINSRSTQQRFEAEQFLCNQQVEKYSELTKEESIKHFSQRMIEIWNEGHEKWEQHVGND